MSLAEISAELLRNHPLPRLPVESDKNARGRIFVVAGGAEVPGAAVLAGQSALRAGAGKLQMAATSAFAQPLAFALPEARVITVPGDAAGNFARSAVEALAGAMRRCDAVVVGPGMLDEVAACELALGLMRHGPDAAFLIDAAAMAGLRGHAEALTQHAGRLVVTPHAGEMAGILEADKASVLADPLGAARDLAASVRAVVALKGATTHVVTPDGRAFRHSGGSVGLGTSGSGDVLAGVIGGLLARGASPLTATLWGVYLHGRAGARLAQRVGRLGFLAREISEEIAPALAEFDAP
jgi:ADP-dependent NAD(P)H-hydrate dehydratase